LISGELPLEEWVSVVRTTIPKPARRRIPRARLWRRLIDWFSRRRRGRVENRPN
jgi:hypothetical protein